MTLALDVAWLPSELSRLRHPAAVVVIDVVRATTSIATALAAGASRVIPAAGERDARRILERVPDGLLCGEVGGVAPAGFDLDNSPRSFTAARVEGRTLIFSTTNGTRAMTATTGAASLRLACFRNLGAVAASVARRDEGECDRSVLLVCSGRAGRVSMDDAWCAGHLVRRLATAGPATVLTDGARAAAALAAEAGPPTAAGLAATAAGGALGELGLEADLEVCARLDDLALVPVWRDGAFVTGGGGGDSDVG